jgi:hypothetical protein
MRSRADAEEAVCRRDAEDKHGACKHGASAGEARGLGRVWDVSEIKMMGGKMGQVNVEKLE